jgi:glycolate oxidase
MRIPAMLAPLGSLQVFLPEGAAASAQAAGDFGTIHAVSSLTEPSLEATAATGSGPKIFQLYVQGDLDWCKAIIERVKAAGYIGLAITVDTAIYSRRERPMVGRWSPPTRRGPQNRNFLSELTWDTLDAIKEMWGGPLLLKGIGTGQDAQMALDHGVDVLWVSNHGGRQLDHGLGALDVLPEVVEVAGGRVPIIVDGGVQRGTDILKAIALGAQCVAIGRLQGWGLGAAGAEGVQRVLELLENEMLSAMGLMGVTSIAEVTPKYVARAEAVHTPHEMSMWPNMPVGRIQ